MLIQSKIYRNIFFITFRSSTMDGVFVEGLVLETINQTSDVLKFIYIEKDKG